MKKSKKSSLLEENWPFVHNQFREFFKVPEALEIPYLSMRIPIDISKTDEEYIIKADLPGFEKDNINLKVTENSIEISASKEKDVEEKNENYFKRERSTGTLKRLIGLNNKIITENTEAKFENGVLNIKLMLKEKSKEKEKKIDIK